MPQSKGNAPKFLQENYKRWGKEYADKRAEDPRASFNWKSYQGQPVNQHIRDFFSEYVTNHHCSYCDGFPLGPFARKTIDHFRPKFRFPRLAYVWGNLFLCCDVCQTAKDEQFDRKLLKPDVDDYKFEHYFTVNYRTGEIEINPMCSQHDQTRAELTISMFGLNEPDRLHDRLRHIKLFDKLMDDDFEIDDLAYHFCFM